jgi:hypothetical protein
LEETKAVLSADLEDHRAKIADVMAANASLLHSMKRHEEHQRQHHAQVSELESALQRAQKKFTHAQSEILGTSFHWPKI